MLNLPHGVYDLISITNLTADIPTQKQLGHAENETPTPFSPLTLSLIM